MNPDELTKAIKFLRPTAQFSFIECDYSSIKWDVLDGAAPTYQEIEVALEKIKTDEGAKEISKSDAKQSLLERLGLTADEAALLLS